GSDETWLESRDRSSALRSYPASAVAGSCASCRAKPPSDSNRSSTSSMPATSPPRDARQEPMDSDGTSVIAGRIEGKNRRVFRQWVDLRPSQGPQIHPTGQTRVIG